ncbi:hypothetical protein CQS04_05040 [Chryseomicrobium excrementi]|uniref:Uncharacterized protein n=1 Tax=Chryseomicrobium excrementi TaxID=2041346 RepID=A0A2M9EZA7_9BACL|nr:hypothetical protein CQS04_05040 [Chryseomicrobium excrementi]
MRLFFLFEGEKKQTGRLRAQIGEQGKQKCELRAQTSGLRAQNLNSLSSFPWTSQLTHLPKTTS